MVGISCLLVHEFHDFQDCKLMNPNFMFIALKLNGLNIKLTAGVSYLLVHKLHVFQDCKLMISNLLPNVSS